MISHFQQHREGSESESHQTRAGNCVQPYHTKSPTTCFYPMDGSNTLRGVLNHHILLLLQSSHCKSRALLLSVFHRCLELVTNARYWVPAQTYGIRKDAVRLQLSVCMYESLKHLALKPASLTRRLCQSTITCVQHTGGIERDLNNTFSDPSKFVFLSMLNLNEKNKNNPMFSLDSTEC